jgi:hypothetical protein
VRAALISLSAINLSRRLNTPVDAIEGFPCSIESLSQLCTIRLALRSVVGEEIDCLDDVFLQLQGLGPELVRYFPNHEDYWY